MKRTPVAQVLEFMLPPRPPTRQVMEYEFILWKLARQITVWAKSR